MIIVLCKEGEGEEGVIVTRMFDSIILDGLFELLAIPQVNIELCFRPICYISSNIFLF